MVVISPDTDPSGLLRPAEPSSDRQPEAVTVVVCQRDRGVHGASCIGHGGAGLVPALQAAARARGLSVTVRPLACMGRCDYGPMVRIVGGPFVSGVRHDDLQPVFDAIADHLAAETKALALSDP